MVKTSNKPKQKVVMDSKFYSKASNKRWDLVRNEKITAMASKVETVLVKNATLPTKEVSILIAKVVIPKPKSKNK